jgi:hypothetical protein
MKASHTNHFEVRRRLVVNPWLEESATVPLKFMPAGIGLTGIKCERKWGSWRNLLSARKPPGRHRLSDDWL